MERGKLWTRDIKRTGRRKSGSLRTEKRCCSRSYPKRNWFPVYITGYLSANIGVSWCPWNPYDLFQKGFILCTAQIFGTFPPRIITAFAPVSLAACAAGLPGCTLLHEFGTVRLCHNTPSGFLDRLYHSFPVSIKRGIRHIFYVMLFYERNVEKFRLKTFKTLYKSWQKINVCI